MRTQKAFRLIGVMVPRERLMLVHAWAETQDDGRTDSGIGWYEVVGVEVCQTGAGIVRAAQILVGGMLVSSEEALARYWPRSSVCEIFLAHWPRDCDECQLASEGARLERLAVSVEKGRRERDVRKAQERPQEAREAIDGANPGQMD
jgi:hypothetical protein